MEDGTSHTEHCMLCNYKIWNSKNDNLLTANRTMMSKFRTVFTTPDSQWKGAHLSDAARSSAWRNGIPGYNHPNNRRTHYWRERTQPTQWKVARNYDFFQQCVQGIQFQNIVWLFPFHAHCWEILEDAGQALEIPLDIQAIYDVALTFHYEDTLRNASIVEQFRPGENQYSHWTQYHNHPHLRISLKWPDAYILGNWDTFTPSRDLYWATKDHDPGGPLNLAERYIERIRRFAEPAGNGVILENTHKLAGSRIDPFSKLPPELHQIIFMELPLLSLFNLRRASRSCAAVTMSSVFFHSRLDPRGPLGYVLKYADAHTSAAGHWRYAFDSALKIKTLPMLDYRKTAWAGAVDLLDLVRLRLEAPICRGSEGIHAIHNSRRSQRVPYVPPRQPWSDSFPGEDPASKLHQFRRWLEICKPLERVDVSTMRLHHRQFITGMSFHYEDGTSSDIGYIHTETAVTAWSFELAQTRKINYISVAMDKMGVRGIALHHLGRVTWAGDSSGYEVQTQKITLRGWTPRREPRYAGRFIDVSFDNLKMCNFQ